MILCFASVFILRLHLHYCNLCTTRKNMTFCQTERQSDTKKDIRKSTTEQCVQKQEKNGFGIARWNKGKKNPGIRTSTFLCCRLSGFPDCYEVS